MENTEENKPVEKERKSLKVWSDNLQRFYYKSKDPNYYNDYFHKTKRPMTCGICGKTITCQKPSKEQNMHYEKARTRNRPFEKGIRNTQTNRVNFINPFFLLKST